MKKLVVLFLLLLFASLSAQAGSVHVLTVQGAISPASADYLLRGIAKAEEAQAKLIVIELDTPGGLDTSMRDIIKAILASPVPVATYVAPEGARAASAGTYILYASHVAAMAPATNLGAATPVELAPGGAAPEKPAMPATEEKKPAQGQVADKGNDAVPQDVKMQKAVHDASAYIRSLAELRGRNAEWAERAVRESVSLSAEAALKANVIDVIATDVDDLLKQIDGRQVKLVSAEVTLDTRNLEIVRIEPDWRSELLAVIGNPGFAYILLLLGIYGLIYEFSNPGMLFPGVIGSICLLLALFALQLMPINYVGLALIILGIALMASEAVLPSFGALGLGGLAAFVIGSIMLIDTDVPGYGISWALITPVAATTVLFSFMVVGLAIRARKRPVVTGAEQMIGAEGEVLAGGWARVHSELWRVRSREALVPGMRVRVSGRQDLVLEVEPISVQKESNHV
jgi:membrane-bound serine protease (ClpP class)